MHTHNQSILQTPKYDDGLRAIVHWRMISILWIGQCHLEEI